MSPGALLWYSVDLWSGLENAAFEVQVLPDAPNDRLLTSLTAASRALAAGIDATPADTRGFHPFGSPDAAGFAAMACDELLVHGDDAARGLHVAFSPDRSLAAGCCAASSPGTTRDPDDDPWEVLLWANGRRDLRGRPAPGPLALAHPAVGRVGRRPALSGRLVLRARVAWGRGARRS